MKEPNDIENILDKLREAKIPDDLKPIWRKAHRREWLGIQVKKDDLEWAEKMRVRSKESVRDFWDIVILVGLCEYRDSHGYPHSAFL